MLRTLKVLSEELGLGKAGVTMQGLSAGASRTQSLVDLDDAALCCNSVSKGEVFKLPPNLKAIVTDFPQEHLDPAINVEGMLGMELLEQFDVDFDFPKGRLRLYRPGTVGSVAERDGLAKVEAVVVNETRLLGIRVVPASAPRDGDAISSQPFLGVLDCGSSFTVVNSVAAPLLGLPPLNDPSYKNAPQVAGMGVDGRSIAMPTANVRLSYVGNPVQDKTQRLAFEAPPSSWKPWDGVLLAVGDLPIFSNLLGDGKFPYQGPAGIIGLDILSQRRLILETSSGRQRKIYVG